MTGELMHTVSKEKMAIHNHNVNLHLNAFPNNQLLLESEMTIVIHFQVCYNSHCDKIIVSHREAIQQIDTLGCQRKEIGHKRDKGKSMMH